MITQQGGSLQRDLPSSQSKTPRASPSLGIGLVVYDFIIYILVYKQKQARNFATKKDKNLFFLVSVDTRFPFAPFLGRERVH